MTGGAWTNSSIAATRAEHSREGNSPPAAGSVFREMVAISPFCALHALPCAEALIIHLLHHAKHQIAWFAASRLS